MNKSIADIISQTRQNKKMTQEEFASRLGVTPQAVSRWERGNGLPDVAIIPGICDVLQINSNELLGIKENTVVENNDFIMENKIKNNMIAEPLMIEFGTKFIPCFIEGLKTDFLNESRNKLVLRTGMIFPKLRVLDNEELKENELLIKSYDKVLFEKKFDCIDENTYYEVINIVTEQCEKNYQSIINKHIVKIMIDNLKKQYPGVVEGLIPEKISYLQVLIYLRKEIEEKGNIRDLIHIVERMELALE